MELTNKQDFGQYLSYKDGYKSNTATRKGIDNEPKKQEIYNAMLNVYTHIYVPLIEHFHRVIPVSSFYRCLKLNTSIGGSKTSGHMNGQCIDLDVDGSGLGLTNNMILDYARKHLDFDQIIWEFNNPDGSPSWVHIGYISKEKNRHQVLKATKVNGKTVYQEI